MTKCAIVIVLGVLVVVASSTSVGGGSIQGPRQPRYVQQESYDQVGHGQYRQANLGQTGHGQYIQENLGQTAHNQYPQVNSGPQLGRQVQKGHAQEPADYQAKG